jgi:hypothetical protein
MGEMRQSPQERAELAAKWQAIPAVIALGEATHAFAAREGLKFDPAGLTAILHFGNAHIAAHGELPDSGILTG